MPKEYIQQWCTKCYDCPNGKVSHEGSITCHDKLPNTTTTSTTTSTPVTTTTTTRYLAPYTAATQATKQTTVESVISAKVQSMNLSNPIWIAVRHGRIGGGRARSLHSNAGVHIHEKKEG